jgi:hypothetical protein
MRTSTARLALVVIVFVAALAGALLMLQSRSSDSGSKGSNGSNSTATSDIWKVGDDWVVKVKQNAGAISPGGETNVAAIPFHFRVAEAPEGEDGGWLVRVRQDGAEGPFAAGWRLEYVEQDGKMILKRVAVGAEPWLEAEIASIALGVQFPYEPSYSAPPKDSTISAEKLLDRSELPPGALPDGAPTAPSGATPPAEAPKLSAGGAPDPS